MFRHKGKNRTFSHNLRLASMLSLVAGIVNVTGVMGLKVLTTNVTGHFAYFAEEMVIQHYSVAIIFSLYILSFLLGAFFSNLLIEIFIRKRAFISYVIPISVEILLLLTIALGANNYFNNSVTACILLFAMGLQNALVTKISNSVVRTTHLTGLFTDLGIELSQLIFYKRNESNFRKLFQSINLKLAIILCFFMGCLLSGVLYKTMHFHTLFIAVVILLFALFFDSARSRYYHLKRKLIP